MMRIIVLVLVIATLGSGQRRPPRPTVKIPQVSQQCLNCICEASTGCDENIRCHNAGANAYFCGPYVISWAYWAEAGKPGRNPNNAQDFEVCLNNKECAEKTIQGYMQKHGKDCDGDGQITCDDFALIHKAGPVDCSAEWVLNSDYWEAFTKCLPA